VKLNNESKLIDQSPHAAFLQHFFQQLIRFSEKKDFKTPFLSLLRFHAATREPGGCRGCEEEGIEVLE
jgi:hypothetical protein